MLPATALADYLSHDACLHNATRRRIPAVIMIIKICGITNRHDALSAIDLGADLIGINLVAGPRKLAVHAARTILSDARLAERAVVLLPVGGGDELREDITPWRNLGVSRFQLYGEVGPAHVARVEGEAGRCVLVQSVAGEQSLEVVASLLAGVPRQALEAVLLDAHSPGQLGGTGRQADWSLIADAIQQGLTDGWPPIWLAGGLRPDNVAAAIRAVKPGGIDASSGVESSRGRKDPEKVRQFVEAARSVH